MRLSYQYIAGFFDADGCVSCSLIDQAKYGKSAPSGKSTMMPHVGICNQNLNVLVDIMETFQCGDILACVGNRKRGSTGAYRWEIPNPDIRRVLEKLIPYLQTKKEQARVMLMLLDTRTTKRSRGLSPEVVEHRQALTQRLRELNHADSQAYRTKWVNSVELSKSCRLVARYGETIPSQAPAAIDSGEGVETRSVSANDNPIHERPPRKGRYSPPPTVM